MSNQVDCSELDTCFKVQAILDCDMPEWLYAVQIQAMCELCKVRKPTS